MKKIKILLAIIVLVIVVLVGSFDYYKMSTPNKIEDQNKLEKTWKKELSSGDYTLDNPLIIQNPYSSNELAAYVGFEYEQPVSYEYTVEGDIPFNYSNEEESKTVILPVVGLYNNTNNKVDLTLYNEGVEVESSIIKIDTTNTEIITELNQADIEANNKQELETFMDGKFIIDNYTNVYDANGDLRATAIAPDSDYAYLKIIEDQFLVADKAVAGAKYRTMLFSYSMMGRINPDFFFEAPKDTKFHHDVAQVGDKLYALTSSTSEESDFADSYKESLISVYSISGKLLETIDMSEFYKVDNVDAVNKGSNARDIHLNSLDYYEQENLLIIDSRSYSQIIGYDLDTNEVSWILDDADTVGSDHEDLLLSPIGDIQYPSGEHTAFVANDFIDADEVKDGMLYISVFDNRQCIDSNEKEMTKDLAEDTDMIACSEADDYHSRGLVYEIDLENLTVETIKEIEFNSRSSFKGGFNMLADGYKTTYVANAKNFEVYNSEDELIGTYNLHTKEEIGAAEYAAMSKEEVEDAEEAAFLYRAVAFTTEEIQSFVEIN